MGQLLDLTAQPLNAPPDLSRFTMERSVFTIQTEILFLSAFLYKVPQDCQIQDSLLYVLFAIGLRYVAPVGKLCDAF